MKRIPIPKKAAIAAVSILAFTGTALAVQQSQTTGANEVPPIYTQVEQHEERIDTLEGRADSTESKVEQNANAIETIQVTSGGASAPGSTTQAAAPVAAPSTATAAPAPSETTPEAPRTHPRTITAVTTALAPAGLRGCVYTLYDARENAHQGAVMQPESLACKQVGEILE